MNRQGIRLAVGSASVLLACRLAALATAAESPELLEAGRLQASQQWAPAESLSLVALAKAETSKPPDSTSIATALEYLAKGRQVRRLYRDTLAVSWSTRLVRMREVMRPRDPLALASAELLLGKIAGGTERVPDAKAHFERARELRRTSPGGNDSLVADVDLSTGALLRRSGDLAGAEVALRRAIEIHEPHAATRASALALLYSELGGTLVAMQRFDEAQPLLMKAAETWQAIGSSASATLAATYASLSQLEKNRGDMAQSIDWMQRAIEVSERGLGDRARQTLIYRANLGGRLIEFGDLIAARRLLEPLVEPLEGIFGRGHTTTEQVRTLLGIACFGTGDTLAALRHLAASEAALEERPGDHAAGSAFVLQWRATILRDRGDLEGARATTERALALSRPLGASEGPMRIDLEILKATILAKQSDRTALSAQVATLGALVDTFELAGTPVEGRMRVAQARALNKIGDRDRAWQEALASEALSRNQMIANAGSLPERQALGLSVQWSEALPLLNELARRRGATDVATAWDRGQRWRGWWNRERDLRRTPPASLDTALVGAHARWVAAERSYAEHVVSESQALRDPAVSAALEKDRVAAETAEGRYRALSAQSGATPPASDPSLDEIRARLGPEDALITYAEASDDSASTLVAYVARRAPTPVQLVSLGALRPARAELARWVRAIAEPPGARATLAEREARQLGRACRERLWDPLASSLAGARTVFVVAVPLGDVPWLALPRGNREYLADDERAIRVIEAERDLLAPLAERGTAGAVAIGGPEFDHAQGGAPSALDLRPGRDRCTPIPHLEPLPAATAEAREVAASFGSAPERVVLLTGADASEANFKREAPTHAIVHIATHGVMLGDTCAIAALGTRGVGGIAPVVAPVAARQPKRRAKGSAKGAASEAAASAAAREPASDETPSPWLGRRVWLAFAGANQADESSHADGNEGLLTAEEVVTLDLRAVDWVVLSACHSGAAANWSSEGALGMRRAFHLAGARTVIASLWGVEDEAVREWMRALYAARAAGATGGSEALSRACRGTLAARRASHRSTHPFYWASFTVTGP